MNQAKQSRSTKRTLNIKVLIVSLVVCVVLASTAYGVHKLQMQRTVASLLERATALEKEENWKKAAGYLHRYTRLRPDDAAAKTRLARTYDKMAASQQEKARSIDLYYEALGVAPEAERTALRQRLAELLLEAGRISEAKAEAAELLEADENDTVAHRVWATAIYSEYKAGEVRADEFQDPTLGEMVRRASDLNPENVPLAMTLARIYRRERDLFPEDSAIATSEVERNTRADEVVRDLVAAMPDDADARLAVYYYREEFDLGGSQQALRDALEVAPNNIDVRLAAANYWIRQAQKLGNSETEERNVGEDAEDAVAATIAGLYDQAIEHLRYIIDEIDATHEGAYVALGSIYTSQGQPKQAETVWRQGIREIGEPALTLHLRLAGLLVEEDQDGAETALASLDHAIDSLDRTTGTLRKAVGPSRDLIEAALLIKRGQPGHAIGLLKPIAMQPDLRSEQLQNVRRARTMLAHAYSALGRPDQAARSYEGIVDLAPQAVQPRLAAAAAWLSAGQPDLAIKQYEYVLSKRDNPSTRLSLAIARFQQQARLAAAERDWRLFKRDLNKVKWVAEAGELEQPWRAALLEADYLAASTDPPEEGRQAAVNVLRTVEESHRDVEELLDGLALLYERLGAAEDADRALSRYEALASDATKPKLQRARLLVRRQEFARAEELLRALSEQTDGEPARQARELLASLQLQQSDADDYREQLVKLHEQYPSRTNYLYQLAEIALRSGNYEECKLWEQKIREVEGFSSALYRYFRSRRLLAQAESADSRAFSQAVKEQDRIVSERPMWAPAYELKGIVEQRRGRLENASDAFETAIRLGDTRSSTYQRLVLLLYQQKKFAEADRYLKRLSEEVPQSQALSNLAMSIAAGLNDADRAAAIAKQGVEHRPEDPSAWLWYGQMLLLADDDAAAEKAFQQAIELAPHDPQTWNGMFTYYLRTEKQDEARELIDELPQRLELGPGDMAFVQAQGYELLGDRAAAAAKYQKAAELIPENFTLQMRIARFHHRSQPDVAEKALRQALDLEPASGPARRALAALLTDKGAWQEARELLTKHDAESSTIDQRVHAALLALRRSEDRVSDLESAKRILEDIVRSSSGAADADNLLLALIYTELSRMQMSPAAREQMVNDARRQYLSLVSKKDTGPLPLTLFLRFLFEHDRTDEAEPWLAKLEEIAPATLETLDLRARWLHAVDRTAEIDDLVTATVKKTEGELQTQEQRRQFYASVGRIYSNVDQHDRAIQWYRKLNDLEPNEFAPLARELAAHGFVAESIQICVDAADRDTSSRPATVAAAILAMNGAPSKASLAAEATLDSAIREHADDATLAMAVANLRVVQGRHQEAVKLYERVVETEPRDATALNNLATLLAEEPTRLDEALRYINRAIAIVGPRAALLDTKGTILIAAARSKEAVPILETAASFPNADPRYHFHLAVALDRVGDTEHAAKAFQQAVEGKLESQILTSTDRAQLQELREKYEDL